MARELSLSHTSMSPGTPPSQEPRETRLVHSAALQPPSGTDAVSGRYLLLAPPLHRAPGPVLVTGAHGAWASGIRRRPAWSLKISGRPVER